MAKYQNQPTSKEGTRRRPSQAAAVIPTSTTNAAKTCQDGKSSQRGRNTVKPIGQKNCPM